MNDIVESTMTYMMGLDYPTETMNDVVPTLGDKESIADAYECLNRPNIDKLKEDGYTLHANLYVAYLSTIKDTRDICSYSAMKSRFLVDVIGELKQAGYSEEVIHAALDGKSYVGLSDAEAFVEDYLQKEAKRAENIKIQQQLESQKDYSEEILRFIDSQNIHVVHPHELADEYYSMLSSESKVKYGNNPTYAVHMNLKDQRLVDALHKCVERFNHSKLVDMVIDEYIEKNYPNEEKKNVIIDKLSAMCPEIVRSDDIRANAYNTIISVKDKESEQDDVNTASANLAAKVLKGESLKVAQDTCSKAVNTAKRAMERFTSNPASTVEDSVKQETDKDEEFRKSVQSQMEEYQKTIERLQKQVDAQEEELHRGNYSQSRYRDDIYAQRGYRGNMYASRRYDERGAYGRYNRPAFPSWLIGVMVNLVIMLAVFFVGSLADIPIGLGQVGLIIASIGYPMLGRHKDAKRFLICGYGLFIIWLLWSVLL